MLSLIYREIKHRENTREKEWKSREEKYVFRFEDHLLQLRDTHEFVCILSHFLEAQTLSIQILNKSGI